MVRCCGVPLALCVDVCVRVGGCLLCGIVVCIGSLVWWCVVVVVLLLRLALCVVRGGVCNMVVAFWLCCVVCCVVCVCVCVRSLMCAVIVIVVCVAAGVPVCI